MAPDGPRKRAKPNPIGEEERTTEVPAASIPLPADESPSRVTPEKGEESSSKSLTRESWYNKTWPRKAAAVTQVARESISSGMNTASEAVPSTPRKNYPTKSERSPSLQLTLGNANSGRSLPANATTTIIHATPEGKSPKPDTKEENPGTLQSSQPNAVLGAKSTESITKPKEASREQTVEESGPRPGRSQQSDGKGPVDGAVSEGRNSGAWLGWFSKSATEPTTLVKPSTEVGKPPKTNETLEPQKQAVSAADTKVPAQPDVPAEKQSQTGKRTWLQMWGGDSPAQPNQSAPDPSSDPPKPPSNLGLQPVSQSLLPSNPSGSASQSKASSIETTEPPELPGDGSKSSGWIFWSRDKKTNSTTTSEPHIGELAISDTPSQKRPKRASISLKDPKTSNEPVVADKAPAIQSKEPETKAKSGTKESRPSTPTPKPQDSKSAVVESPSTKGKASEAAATSKQVQKPVVNALLPTFKDTFALEESPTLLQQLGRLFYYTKTPEMKHLSRVRDPPRITNAIAIGVHGYFPTPLIRTVLGQPTGTSIKFADMAAKAIRKWTSARGYTCEVKTAALEGEGRIAERVEILWKLLLNWIDEIRKADFVMVACHSQGVPVAMQLVAKLIEFGCFNSNSVKISICAMAGVNMGPFTDYKSRWISGSAGELFDFSNPATTVSKNYVAALESVLKFGARITFVGSIDDQLVSLESSVFAIVSHPHIYRAVFIDGRVHAPNFLSHLVGLALKLRNLGVPDHGLIRELSAPLAGSLYMGEGHSRIYDDDAVYDLAVDFALETTSIYNADLTAPPIPTPASSASATSTSQNPYILPFAMRGLLEEDYVKTELHNEVSDLLHQFDDWKPTTKALKDVKFRLEGVRSKL